MHKRLVTDPEVVVEIEKLYDHFRNYDDVFISEIPDVDCEIIMDSFDDLDSRLDQKQTSTKALLARLLMKYDYAQMTAMAAVSSERGKVGRYSYRMGSIIVEEFTEPIPIGVTIDDLRAWLVRDVIDAVVEYVETTQHSTKIDRLKELMAPVAYGNIVIANNARHQLERVAADAASEEILGEHGRG